MPTSAVEVPEEAVELIVRRHISAQAEKVNPVLAEGARHIRARTHADLAAALPAIEDFCRKRLESDEALETLRLKLVGLGWLAANLRARSDSPPGEKPSPEEFERARIEICDELRAALQATREGGSDV